MGKREATVEQYLHKRVLEVGGTTRKWVSPSHRGVPDRIVFHGGIVFFVEVKTEDGRLGDEQAREHERLRKHGAAVLVVHGKQGVDDLIDMMKEAEKQRDNAS